MTKAGTVPRRRWRGGTRLTFAATAAVFTIVAVSPQPARAQAREDTTTRMRVLPALGLRVGTPQKASAALGVVVGQFWQKNGRDHTRSVTLFAEPGLGAGRASLAYFASGFGPFGSGVGLAATGLRTWKDPWTVNPDQSYVGAELILWPVVFVGPRIGVFRNVSHVETSRHWLLSIDFGIGV